ncbi:MAG: helix-turn-helix transcriptional regulator [Stackebrandtia sp.]
MITDVPRLGAGNPLIARRAELRTLQDAFRAARTGRPSVVLLSGDAGVGKSRLLSELSDLVRADDGTVVIGRCLDTVEAALPYLPFAEAVGRLADADTELTDGLPALRRLLPGQQATDDHELSQLQLFDAVHAMLSRFTADRPLVLAIEDLHWADRSSRDLFAFLASRLSSQRLLVVGTYRTDDLHRRHPLRPLLAELVRLPMTERLHLGPFEREDARAFVRSLAEETVDEDLVARIAERSEGNAFMAEELVSASSASVPQDLAEVLLSRVERLSAPSQQLMRLASVIGRHFGHDRLAATTELSADDLDTALREAIAHHVLVMDDEGDTYAFRHALLREAVYTDLLPGERSRLHRRFAETLTGDDRPGAAAELAHHSLESHDTAGALAASIRAAREADELAAPAETLAHVEQALQLWQGVDDPASISGMDELSLTLWAARAAAASGEPDRAIALSRSAIKMTDELGDRLRASRVRRDHANYLFTLEGFEVAAYESALEACDLIRDREPGADRAWAQAILARAAYGLVRRDEAERIAGEAMADAVAASDYVARATARPDVTAAAGTADVAATPDDLGCLAAWAYARVTEILALGRRTLDNAETLDLLAEAAAVARQAGAREVELRARFQRAMRLLDGARLSEAMRELDAVMAEAATAGLRWSGYGLETSVMQVVGRFMIGDWDGAEAVSDLAADGVSRIVRIRVLAAGLLVSVGRGHFEAADRWMPYLREWWHVDQQVMTLVSLCGTELESWRGRPDKAVVWAEEALAELRKETPIHLAALSLSTVGISAYADLAVEARRTQDAEAEHRAVADGERLVALVTEAVENGVPLTGSLGPEGRAWWARARAEAGRLRGGSDASQWREVIEAFDYGESYRQAYARWRLAETLLGEGGDRAEAAEQLGLAAKVADELRAVPLGEAVAGLARRARLRSDATVTGTNPLTPRELAVLRLVAKGKTNRQIGSDLFISEKTVSVHLSRVMAKLEASSRTEAVSIAHTRGHLGTGES